MKRSKYLILIALVIILILGGFGSEIAWAKQTISTNASATALIDVTSGRLLYSEDGDIPMRIASLTKIMTAIVAIEYGDLASKVKVSKRAAGKEGSSIYLRIGEEMTLSNMLYGLMLRSGNDAATAIAEHVGGSEAGFVYLMNEKAKELGLENTQFRNPSGLDHDEHYSSANDLAILTAYALRNKVFAEIVKTEEKQAPNPYEKWNYKWRNKNKMLRTYEGADGVKTGYTKKAFRCLVSSATRNGQQLVAVTLNDGNDWDDHQKLLDYGFNNYPLSVIAKKEEGIAGSTLVYGQPFLYPLAGEELGKITADMKLVDAKTVHYALGDRGKMNFYLEGSFIGSVPIYEAHSARLKINYEAASEETFTTFKKNSQTYSSWLDKIKSWLD